jgi:hypothetical protein
MTKKIIKTKKELRKFGFVMTLPLAIIGGILLWRGRTAAPYFLSIAAFFLLSGLFLPSILRPIEWVWMKIAEIISAVMTRVILTLTFYLVITPVGLIMRIFGKDLLQMKFKSKRDSYWVPVEKDGPFSRPDKPY